jgi:signal transduction histidine kinase
MLSPSVTTALYRITQEALTNISRHAHTSTAQINLEAEGDFVKLEIRDEGKGFDKTAIHNERSFGLIGMRERIHQLDGDFEIISRPGEGTTIRVRVPKI